MMEYIFSCMAISVKGVIGTFLWAFVAFLLFFIIACIVYAISGEWKKKVDNFNTAKPKYKRDPILIKGGKEEKDE